MYRPRDFASYILGIFICNLLLYLAFYIIMKVTKAAVAVLEAPVSKGEGVDLFSGCNLGSCGAAGGCRGPLWGSGWDRVFGRDGVVAISGVAGLCLCGVGSPSQMQMVQVCVSPVHGSVPWEGLRVCPCLQLRSSEKLLPIPMFCIVATAVVWAAALYFFFQTLSSWEVNFPFTVFPSISFSSSFLPGVCFAQKKTLEKSLGLLMGS